MKYEFEILYPLALQSYEDRDELQEKLNALGAEGFHIVSATRERVILQKEIE